MSFGGAIMRAYRAHMGWSQEKLAEKLHLSRSAVSKIENDQQMFDVNILAKLIRLSNEPTIAFSIICGVDGLLKLLGG
ncbi:helix-turn-helix domain-containing protein [Paenibacillus senegalensis]|uniref:helix-turn-helix domain-containing protein n=1 Tax=Paenibacillus senegalensis TaxID=1465766 RepID=UPI00028A3ACB|nr:helix-turn-helix transcriptional regulator [Paenibacillus senegalensis]